MPDQDCDARILVWTDWIASNPPHTAGIANCEKTHIQPIYKGTVHNGHLGHEVITFDGGTNRPEFTWYEDDRRTFRGELIMCPWQSMTTITEGATVTSSELQRCTLPVNHNGNHAP